MSLTVISGKSTGKLAHLNSRPCGKESFVPDFIRRHRGEALIKSSTTHPLSGAHKNVEQIPFTSGETSRLS